MEISSDSLAHRRSLPFPVYSTTHAPVAVQQCSPQQTFQSNKNLSRQQKHSQCMSLKCQRHVYQTGMMCMACERNHLSSDISCRDKILTWKYPASSRI